MRGLALALALVAAPAGAETADERQDRQCRAAWEAATANPAGPRLTGSYDGLEDGWCAFSGIFLVTEGYTPDVEIDKLRLKGDALGAFLLDERLDPDLDLAVQFDGLRMVPQVDQPQLDWLYRAQFRAYGISGDMALDWDAATREVTLSQLSLDFPGSNSVSFVARVEQVDLSSMAAAEMSATSFALTEATLDVTSHGLFETYLLLALGGIVLPYEGDMDAAAETLRADTLAVMADLPVPAFSAASKDALARLVQELPNPSGRLTVDFTAQPGFGSARFGFMALKGIPTTVDEASSLFQGIVADVTWTHQDMPD